MSETTDTPAPPAAATAVVGSSPDTVAVPVSVADLVRLSQGFYFIFWGLLVTVLVSAQIIVTLWLRTFAEAFLLGAVVATVVGTWRLRQARLTGGGSPAAVAGWRRRVGWLWGVVLLLAYFSLLFYLWRRLPSHPYLQVNALAFVACGLLYLILLNLAVAALARALGRHDLAIESRLFVAGNVLLLLLPLVAAGIYLVLRATHQQTNVVVELQGLLGRLNLLVLVVLLLPLSLTLSLVWAAKDLALRALTAGDHQPAAPAAP